MKKHNILGTPEFQKNLAYIQSGATSAYSSAWHYGGFLSFNSIKVWVECWEYGFTYEDELNNPNGLKYRVRLNYDDSYRESFHNTLKEAEKDFKVISSLIFQGKKVYEIGEKLGLKVW